MLVSVCTKDKRVECWRIGTRQQLKCILLMFLITCIHSLQLCYVKHSTPLHLLVGQTVSPAPNSCNWPEPPIEISDWLVQCSAVTEMGVISQGTFFSVPSVK